MSETKNLHDDDLFNPETHHEHSDVPVRPLWIAMIVFLVFAVVSHVVLWFLYKAFVMGERNRDEVPLTAIARPANAGVPQNQPLLQPFPREGSDGNPLPPNRATPVVDLIEMRAAEKAVLDSYGWVDRQHGVVHIPIDEAKNRAVAMLQNATPVVPAAAVTPSSPAAVPDTGVAPAAASAAAGGGVHQ